ncbi:glycosyl hydrolase family 92-domain-containing protein [Mycena olivaceomarginata]|nr:glycosyl hydrolase family 92-domain-containing protein [Mycena olivaceomarginata]
MRGNDLTKCALTRSLRAIEQATLPHRQATAGTDQLLLLLEVTGGLSGTKLPRHRTSYGASNPTTKGTRVTGSGSFIPSLVKANIRSSSAPRPSIPFVQAKYYENLEYTDVNQTTFDKDIQRAPAGLLMGFAPGAEHTLSACAYAEQEIPDISAFDTVHTAARAKWNEVLGTVEVDATGVSDDSQQLFWTSLYRTYISPTNITGDNPLWSNSTEPYWDSFYCIWDTFRVIHPSTPSPPDAQAEVIRRSSTSTATRASSGLPHVARQGLHAGGSNADSLLADSLSRSRATGRWRGGAGLRRVISMGTYRRTMRTIRRAMLGTPGASRLLEYAYNDFSIALVAQGLNSTTNATHFFNKSSDWFNLWNFNASNTGFAGFIQPRNADGSWFFDSRSTAMVRIGGEVIVVECGGDRESRRCGDLHEGALERLHVQIETRQRLGGADLDSVDELDPQPLQ